MRHWKTGEEAPLYRAFLVHTAETDKLGTSVNPTFASRYVYGFVLRGEPASEVIFIAKGGSNFAKTFPSVYETFPIPESFIIRSTYNFYLVWFKSISNLVGTLSCFGILLDFLRTTKNSNRKIMCRNLKTWYDQIRKVSVELILIENLVLSLICGLYYLNRMSFHNFHI